MKPIIWPYKLGSASAKTLAQALETKRVRSDGRYKPFRNHLIINWGNNNVANWQALRREYSMLNLPQYVRQASDKVSCLRILDQAGIPTPVFSTNQGDAESLFEHSRRVYCRTLTRASEGRGIVVAHRADELVNAPLYTAGIDGHRKEYRVHVVNGTVIDIVQKKKMTDKRIEENEFDYSPHVRNHDRGWVFARMEVTPPDSVSESAIAACQALSLDFGAVDIIVRDDYPNTAFVLEVNTAPGLEGTTLETYVNAFRRLL